jgi:hypothetical protein
MKATKTTVPELIEKEAETVTFLDRHNLNWFFNTETNELRIGACLSDFLDKKTENFIVKKIHLCDVKYWKIAETEDGKFILLNRNKVLK